MKSEMSPLTGRLAVITGGSRGIGAACGVALAEEGGSVALTYQADAASAELVAKRCRSVSGAAAHVVAFDMSDPESTIATLTELGDVDILVLNAAAPYKKASLSEMPVASLTTKVSHDVAALHTLVSAFAPGMRHRGFGRIVVIGSMHAHGPIAPGMAANGIAKAAVAAYVNYAVDELTGNGVTINLVDPGYIATDASAGLPPVVSTTLNSLTPIGRAGTPNDVSNVVRMLVRPESEYVNGARISVTGGLNQPMSLRRVLATGNR